MLDSIHRKTYAEVNLSRLEQNYTQLKQLCGSYFFCPMVKSNAYGHGDKEVLSVLSKCSVKQVGVALIEEAMQLREAGFSKVDILFFGAFKESSLKHIFEFKITPVVSSWEELKLLSSKTKKPWPVHIKFNTGMNRFGFEESEALALVEFFKGSTTLQLKGVCSHLACGEDILQKDGFSALQLERFNSIRRLFPNQIFHLLNSSGFLALFNSEQEDMDLGVRLGLLLYGVVPASFESSSLDLKPVMQLKSEVVAYHKLKQGDCVSYGATWAAKRTSTIGIVPIGYSDGYDRQFSNKGQVLFRGQKVPVVGAVCMDYLMVDLTDALAGGVGACGEEIVLFGEQKGKSLGVTEVAQMAGKISYELLTNIGRRVPRVYIEGP